MRTARLLVVAFMMVSSSAAHADIINYKLKFDKKFGPSGMGNFTFEACPPNAILPTCPNLAFATAFSKDDPDLIFDQLLRGGGAEALLGFFQGDPSSGFFPAINLASFAGANSPISNILSFESAGEGLSNGIYCMRPSHPASGLCADDPSAIGIGVWSAKRVPEPGTLALLGIGLAGMGLSKRGN